MELKKLEGSIIGVIPSDLIKQENFNSTLVKDIIKVKIDDSLKMVKLDLDIKDKAFNTLSSMEKNKVILASKLQDDVIILNNFSKGLITKEREYFKKLFKKIASYHKKIILVTKDIELFLNCVDTIYLINNDNIVYKTNDYFDPALYIEGDIPPIIDFIYKCEDLKVRLDEYTDINELIKAIYRIKS